MILYILVVLVAPSSEAVAMFRDASQCQLTAKQLSEHPDNYGVKFECRTVTKI